MRLAILISLTSCASNQLAAESTPAERLPSAEEVAAHVRAEWAADYGKRFARFEERDGEEAELTAVSNVSCGYYYVTPECSFDIVARFADGERRRRMIDQFGWTPEGRLQAVFVMYHERRR